MSEEGHAASAENRLAGYLAKYEPAIAKLGKALRTKLRGRLPGLHEVVYVYENQESLVISYSPTEKGYEAPCAISVDPRSLRLCFGQGAQLKDSDPQKLLQGRGKTVRHLVIEKIADFDRPDVEALIAAALKLAKLQLDANAKGSVIIRAESQQQRAKRASKAAPPASKSRTTKQPRAD